MDKNSRLRLSYSPTSKIRMICSVIIIISMTSFLGFLLSSCQNVYPSSLAITEYRGSETTGSTKLWNEELGIYETINIAEPTSTTPLLIAKSKPTETKESEKQNTSIEVHFLDVGSADCTLIIQGKYAMLIDSGDETTSEYVISYLQQQGITKLDYVIGTHLHEDHIGGMDDIIRTFEIGKVFLADTEITTNSTYMMLSEIEEKGCGIFTPEIGEIYTLGEATFQFFAPGRNHYEDLNNRSIVTKIMFGSTSFLMMGDAEGESEEEIIMSEHDIKADVIKIGHHGSYSSTIEGFLKIVSPSSAVISVGIDNDYGHPSERVLDSLIKLNVDVYRTDLSGTIIAISDGFEVAFDKTPEAGQPGNYLAQDDMAS